MKKAQVWSMDYTVGMLFFTVAFTIVAVLLARAFLFTDNFDNVRTNAIAASNHLMSEGYPHNWREDDVILAGVMYNNRFAPRKAERLAAIAKNSTVNLRNLLNAKYELSIVFRDRDDSILPLGTHCSIGDQTETKTINRQLKNIAYYNRGSTDLQSIMNTLNATTYVDEQFDSLLENLYRYDLIVMEHPRLSGVLDESDARKAVRLQAYVDAGADLFIVGNFNLTEFLDLDSQNSTEMNATLVNSNDVLNFSENITFLTNPRGITDTGLDNYKAIQTFGGSDFAATFSYGEGEIYYIGGLDGTHGTDTLLATVETLINETATPFVADCTNVSQPVGEQRVAVNRLLAADGEIITMEVLMWE